MKFVLHQDKGRSTVSVVPFSTELLLERSSTSSPKAMKSKVNAKWDVKSPPVLSEYFANDGSSKGAYNEGSITCLARMSLPSPYERSKLRLARTMPFCYGVRKKERLENHDVTAVQTKCKHSRSCWRTRIVIRGIVELWLFFLYFSFYTFIKTMPVPHQRGRLEQSLIGCLNASKVK